MSTESFNLAIKAMRDEVTKPLKAELTRLRADNERLAKELAEAKRDAERYRWLRVQPNDCSAPRIDVVRWTEEDPASNSGEGLRLHELDAAIDAAMKERQP